MLKSWVLYAFLSMLFAGATSVIAKLGLTGISGDMGLAVRTVFVLAFTMMFAAIVVSRDEWNALTWHNVFWLALSAVTTTLSWIFYYRAIKDGEVSTVAVIDKGSMVVAVILAFVILREQITVRTLIGAACMVAGLLVIAKK